MYNRLVSNLFLFICYQADLPRLQGGGRQKRKVKSHMSYEIWERPAKYRLSLKEDFNKEGSEGGIRLDADRLQGGISDSRCI